MVGDKHSFQLLLGVLVPPCQKRIHEFRARFTTKNSTIGDASCKGDLHTRHSMERT